MQGITADEAEVYDRQIRLWGVDAQTRIRNGHVLIFGTDGLATEVCKNLVLAGIGKLTVIDDRLAMESDLGAGYFLRREDIGQKRVHAFTKRLAELNPRVDIVAVDTLSSIEDLVKESTTVCVTGQSLTTQVRINTLCRTHKKAFLSGDSFGNSAFFFQDLLDHEYTFTKNAGKEDEERVTKSEQFVSLAESLSTSWAWCAKKGFGKRMKNASALFFAIQILYVFEFKFKCFPDTANPQHMQALSEIRADELRRHKVSEDVVGEELVRQLGGQCSLELAPMAAVVGGYAAQEVLKSVSHKDAPLGNWFFFGTDTLKSGAISPMKIIKPQ